MADVNKKVKVALKPVRRTVGLQLNQNRYRLLAGTLSIFLHEEDVELFKILHPQLLADSQPEDSKLKKTPAASGAAEVAKAGMDKE